MEKQEVIRLAREAELTFECDSGEVSPWIEGTDLTPFVLRFAELLEKEITE